MARVYVGLSGGVDSAVSAALLKEAGHQVTGVFIKIWRPQFLECTWREDRLDAMRIAAHLSIPFREIDLSEQYERAVVDEMVRCYSAGVTPNPDVSCNQYIKFGAFAAWANAEGADRIATGHYARTINTERGVLLARGKDRDKDQSYFLHRIDRAALQKAMFPIGEFEKSHVRELARQYHLPVSERPDSQGLCFVGDISMPEFLRRYIEVSKGPVVDKAGAVIGEHEGAPLYTIGQRHGFVLRGPSAGTPHFIIGIEPHSNTVVVSPRKEDGMVTEAVLADVNWLDNPPQEGKEYSAESRYHEHPFLVSIDSEGAVVRARFKKPHLVTPGQSLVVYDGDIVVGGGAIVR